MRTLDTGGLVHIEPVPGGTSKWYYGISHACGDLYEAEEIFNSGRELRGRRLCFVSYPEGSVYEPVPVKQGAYFSEPVYADGGICFLNVDFSQARMQILRFDCAEHGVEPVTELPLNAVRDCYNLGLDIAPLTLRRQGGADGLFEIIWPERVSFPLGEHESFFLREGDRLFFSRWHEEGEGADYRYWEETVVRDLNGEIREILPGDVRIMPNGELWYLK